MADETALLLERWHAGDREALAELIRRNLAFVSDQVRRQLGEQLRDAGQTQDFVQEAMIEVLEYGPRFVLSDEQRFRQLLARIVENQLRMAHRHIHRERRDVDRQRPLGNDTVLYLDPPDKAVTRPSEHADRHEKAAWVRLALELVSAQDREIILWHQFDGLSFAEIGRQHDMDADAARMRFNRAMPRLAAKVVELKSGALSPG